MFSIPRKPTSTDFGSPKGLTAGEDALLAELQKINAALSSQPVTDQTLSSFKANTLLQFMGILAATVFGVFSILAWLAATKSNEISSNALNQALQSNQLALLAYCVSGGNTTSAAAICANVLGQASAEMGTIVSSALPGLPTVTSATSSSTSVSSTSSFSATTETLAPPSTSSSARVTSYITFTTSSTPAATAAAPTGSPPTTGSSPNGSNKPSSIGPGKVGAIIGAVVGASAAIAIVFLYIWRRRAYREMSRRVYPQEIEKSPVAS